jgi:hypothetical protein
VGKYYQKCIKVALKKFGIKRWLCSVYLMTIHWNAKRTRWNFGMLL